MKNDMIKFNTSSKKCDFGFKHYQKILNLLKEQDYRFCFFEEEPDKETKRVYLRHDIDYSPEKALELAKIENQNEVVSTFFVRLSCPFYNIFDSKYSKLMGEITSLGHALGLHFEGGISLNLTKEKIEENVCRQLVLLKHFFNIKEIVSFHQPPELVLNKEFIGFISAYEPKFFTTIEYISDSKGRWKHGCICSLLSSCNSKKNIHLLTHPIWWGRGEEDLKDINKYLELYLKERLNYLNESLIKDNKVYKKRPEPIKASQIALFLGKKLYGKDVLIKKPVPVSELSSNCVSFIKNEIVFDKSLISAVNKHTMSLVICPLNLKDDIKSSFIISERPYYEFSLVVKKFFDCAEPKITIGKNCNIKKGVVIGGEGFSYRKDENRINQHITNIGGVVIGDNVDIGSGTMVDRGILTDTVIENNVKIDNLVHIGHNCTIGEGTMITAGAVLGGGVVIGKNCFIGLNSCIKQRIKIGDDSLVGMGAVVIKDVPPNTTVIGNPAKPLVRELNK